MAYETKPNGDKKMKTTDHKKSVASRPAQGKMPRRQDPTARWSERVREMSSSFKNSHRPVDYTKHKDEFTEDKQPAKLDLQHITEVAQECISKRPLTSMVIAATAGAAITALLAALVAGGKRSGDR